MGKLDDHCDDKWSDAVISLLTGTNDKLKVKSLRKLVFLSLQVEESDKLSKKKYKQTIQALENSGQLKLDAEGHVKLSKQEKKKTEAGKTRKRKSRQDDDGAGDEVAFSNAPTSDDETEANNATDASVPSKHKKGRPCSGNPQGVTRLFLGNLPFTVDEASLTEFLPGLTHIKWITDKETGKFYGSAFVEIDTPLSAASAVGKAGEQMLGRPIKINFAPARVGDVWPPLKKVISGNQGLTTGGQAGGKGIQAMSAKPDKCTKLFIGNLSYDIDDEGITKFFAAVDAEVKIVRWIHHKDSGDFKGVGFVEFWNEEACEKAATLNGKDLLGRPIRIDWDGQTTN
jgi:nucleolin